MRIYTAGHSTRSADELIELLREHDVERLVDVRRFPGSRRHPHFNGATMEKWLVAAGIDYAHEVDLGGRRKGVERVEGVEGVAGSPNTAWRVAGFRAYADYMDTPGFRAALDRLVAGASTATTAIMCAEVVPWRCHRRLISDVLVARGIDVVHILGPDESQPHELHPDAKVLEDGRLLYPKPPPDQMRFL